MEKNRIYRSFWLCMLGIVIAGSGISHPVWAGEKAKTVMDMAKENEKEEGTEEGEPEDEDADWLGQWVAEKDMRNQRYPLLEDIEEGEKEDYIFLLSPEAGVYRIKEGDTLWKIAQEYYDKGEACDILKRQNPEIPGDGGLIFPGMEISVPKAHYIEKQKDSRGGFGSTACTYDVPADWIFGRPEWEVCLEYSYWPEYADVGVYTHVTENRMFLDDVGNEWEEMQKQIADSAEQAEGIDFHELEFSRYIKEDGTDLLFYTFICQAEEERVKCAVAYVPGEEYLIEFIGYSPIPEDENTPGYQIEEITRYMAASYVEEGGEKVWNSLKYRPYLGYESWPYEDLHNPFAIMERKYGIKEDPVLKGEDREVEFVSKEWERIIRSKISFHYNLTREQEKEFMERPIYASELAWITEVVLVESPIPGRDQVAVNNITTVDGSCADCNLTTFRDLAVLPNLEKVTLEIGSADDYEVLGECPSLKEISITSARPVTNLKWLLNLKELDSLTLNLSMFPHLNELGYEKEGASTFGGVKEKEEEDAEGDFGETSESIEEILAQCTSLKYLRLETTDAMDFRFLDELPELYTFYLEGEDSESEAARQRCAGFGEEDYGQIQCLVVDGVWLRNPE